MEPTKKLHELGQSLWLDNITRELLNSGTLNRYIDELSVTGLTSNPTIFDNAIKNSSDLRRGHPPEGDRGQVGRGRCSSSSRWQDLTPAADLFRPVFDRTDGVDGWVSLEVSPLLAHDTDEHAGGRARPPPARAAGPTCSSRFPAPRRACRRSRRRSSPACRSTSRCCSRASSMSRRPKPTCAASSGASPRD